jgi:hypothetical protein
MAIEAVARQRDHKSCLRKPLTQIIAGLEFIFHYQYPQNCVAPSFGLSQFDKHYG